MRETKFRLSSLSVLVAIGVSVAADPVSAQQVGTAGAVNPAAQASGRVMNVGSNILFKEKISTTAAGSVQVIFVDKTTLNIGPNSDLIIDEFVYNPNTGTGKMAATLTKGVLRVVGGNVTHTEGATVKTPVASVGVRGGVATISHSAQAGTQAINHFGRLTVTSGGTTENVYRAGFGVTVAGNNQAPASPTRATATQVAAAVQTLTSKPGQSGGAVTQPTDSSATAAGLGQISAGLTPATTPSVQTQTASQGAVIIQQTTQITQPISSSPAVQSTTQGVQTAQAAQTVASQTPTTKFFALAMGLDPTLGTPLPFIPTGFYGGTGATGTYYNSPVYGYRRGGVDPTTAQDRFGSTTLFGSISIQGQGAAQSSTFLVMSGGFSVASDGAQFHDVGITGTTRRAANLTMGRLSSSGDSVPGSVVLDADHIPISTTINQNDRQLPAGGTAPDTGFFFGGGGGPNTNFNFTQSLTQASLPPGVGTIRTGATLEGFTAGLASTHHTDTSGNTNQLGGSNVIGGGIVIALDPDRGRLQANATVSRLTPFAGNPNEFSSANWQFGNLAPTARGRSAYIDDRLFGARSAVNEPNTFNGNLTFVSTTNGSPLSGSQQALASADLVQAQGLSVFSGVNFCTCEYTRWGFWSVDNRRANLDGTTESERANLVGWVAGRLATPAEIPTVGTATYNGHVIGSFKNGANEYVAAGNFSSTVNFGTGANSVSIPSLDGRAYSGSVTRTPGQNAFAGNLSGTSGANMALNGAFFRGSTDPVRDVAGRFAVTTPPTNGYIGGGIFAGSR